MNRFDEHVKRDRAKWIAVVVAILILAVAVTAGITKGFTDWNPFGWFGTGQEQTEELPGEQQQPVDETPDAGDDTPTEDVEEVKDETADDEQPEVTPADPEEDPAAEIEE